MVCIQFNLALNYLQYSIFAVINFNVSMLTLAFTLAVFSQLSTINRRYLGQKKINKNNHYNHLHLLLTTFKRYHSQTVVLILSSSAYFGHLLSAFIAIYLPFSTKIVVMLLFTNDLLTLIGSPLAIFSLLVICNFQFVGIFGFHLLAAMFTNRIHGCSKGLLHWAAAMTQTQQEQQQASLVGAERRKPPPYSQLRLHLYIAKFHVPHKGEYGFTYLGGVAGVMSITSFAKVGSILVYICFNCCTSIT